MTTDKGGAPKGVKKSAEHKAKISKAQEGKKNSNWKHGEREDYRKKAGAKPGDSYIVHHKNNVHTDQRKSNLQKLKGKEPGARTSSTHERITPRNQGRKPKG